MHAAARHTHLEQLVAPAQLRDAAVVRVDAVHQLARGAAEQVDGAVVRGGDDARGAEGKVLVAAAAGEGHRDLQGEVAGRWQEGGRKVAGRWQEEGRWQEGGRKREGGSDRAPYIDI